jgi:hypothetical protein
VYLSRFRILTGIVGYLALSRRMTGTLSWQLYSSQECIRKCTVNYVRAVQFVIVQLYTGICTAISLSTQCWYPTELYLTISVHNLIAEATFLCRFYKFFLVFETSICEHYLSDLVWRVLRTSMLPVVFGMYSCENAPKEWGHY